MVELIAFLEDTIREQTTTIAYQEKIIQKLSNFVYCEVLWKEFDEYKIKEIEDLPRFSKIAMEKDLKMARPDPENYEPFKFYGGDFVLADRDKKRIGKHLLFQKQE